VNDFERQIREAIRYLKKHVPEKPRIVLILGSGLGNFADGVENPTIISSADIPHYPTTSVQGHAGKLVFGRVRDGDRVSEPVLVFKGRVHFYETQDLFKVIMPTAVAAGLGAKTMIVTNAAGGINRRFRPGDLMIIRDALNLAFERIPAIKTSRDPGIRNRMHARSGSGELMDERTTQSLRDAAMACGVRMHEGTYCWVKGPTYETAAEIQMFRQLGADAVGMSTVPEIVAGRRLGLKIAGISLISNMATGISAEKLSHQEVTDTANRVQVMFTRLMTEVVLRLGTRKAS